MNKVCPSCGAESPENFRFCGFCAHPLDTVPAAVTSPEPPVEQRSSLRLVTVLFADLTNFTGAAERGDPETIYYTVRKTLESLSHSVIRLGGRIDRYIGDGFLATFGAPEAHEDDPERALRAALEMQQAMIQLTAEASQKVAWNAQLRIGIHTGPVIRGRMDTGPLVDTSVFGHVVNLAHRLQGAARPGTALVSESIYRRARASFNFSEAIRLNLKGIDKPVLGYEVLSRRTVVEPARGLTGRTTPLVGRTAEFDQLITLLERLQVDGQGASILITGEAGIGKSRLAQEALAPVAEHVNVVHTECSPTETGSYSLLKSLLGALVGISPDFTPPERQRRVAETLALSATLTQEIGPVLRDILETGEGGSAPMADPKQEQRRLFGATRRLVSWVARQRPLVLVFDDLHWADSSSLEAIAHIVDLVWDAPLVLVAVARPSARESLTQVFKRADPAQPDSFLDIQLESLSQAESDQLLAMILADVPIPPALKQNLRDRAVGNPLLLEEIVRMLLDEGVIYKAETGWAVQPDWVEAVRRVPDTVNGLVLSRYDRLAPKLRRLLDVAAVFRRRFSAPELAAMAHEPEALIRGQVAELEAADIFRQTASTRVPKYSFRHPLMREAIYETILQAERRALHLEAATVIRHLGSGESQEAIELIAYHLEQGKSPQAGAYLLQAAGRAADRYANAEAMDYYHRLQALDEPGADAPQAVDVALALGDLLLRINRPEAARAELDRALAIASQPGLNHYRLGDLWYRRALLDADQGNHASGVAAFEKAAAIREGQPEQARTFTRSDIDRELGWIFCDQAQYAAAHEHAARALAEALQQADRGAAGSAHNLLSAVYFYTGQLQDSVASAVQALAIREQLGDLWGSASTQMNLGTLYYKLGQWIPAEAYLRQAIFVQQEIGDHYALGQSRNSLSLILLFSGRFDEALHLLDQALTILTAGPEPSPLACMLLLNRGLTWLQLNQPGRALPDLEHSLALATQLKNDNYRALVLSVSAETYLAQGNRLRSRQSLEEAAAIEKAAPSASNRAEILRVQSLALRAERAWPEAVEANRGAAALFKQLGDRHELARSQIAWADLQLAWHAAERGHPVDPACRQTVEEAAQVFKELRAQPDITRAEALLAALAAQPTSGAPAALEDRLRYMAVAQLGLHFAAFQGESLDRPASAAEARRTLVAGLKRAGQEAGAATTASPAGLAYVFNADEAAGAEALTLKAIQCALAARDTAARINAANRQKYNLELPASIGLAAGPRRESGETAGTAGVSYLERQAEALAALTPDHEIYMCVSNELAAAVQREYDLGAVELPPDERLSEPVWRLGQARSGHTPAHRLPGPATRVVGRTRELALLHGWVDAARQAAEGCICYVEAEAGMGKTRLQAEAINYAQPDITCLLGKCEPFRANISFWAFINMLATADLPETEANRRLKAVLGLAPPDSHDEALLRNVSPADLRQEIFGRLREFLLGAAARGPVMLIIEDIHWLDLSSLDLLDFLIPVTREAPLSILLTARAEMAGPHRSLLGKAERICSDRYLMIKFAGLDTHEAESLVRQMLEAPALPDGLADPLAVYKGHPLSLEEGVRYLVETGTLRRTESGWLLDRAPGQTLPRSYRELLLARLETLDSETLHVLQAAAVLGENVDRTVLAHVVPGPTVAGRLSELVERGWLLPPEKNNPLLYRFKHTLTRETIYATLLTSTKRILHQRAGEALEGLYLDALEGQTELLAYHFGRSSQRDKAANYQLRAAEKSAARQALAESLGFYQEANEALQLNPQLRQQLGPRLMLGQADVYLALGIPVSAIGVLSDLLKGKGFDLTLQLQGAAQQRLATARRKAGQLNEALQHLEMARAIFKNWSASQPQLSLAAKDSLERELLQTELGLAQTLFELRQNTRASQQVDYLLSLADRRQHPDLVAQALDLKGGITYRLNNVETALRLVQDSLSIYQATGNRAGAAAAYANLGVLNANSNQAEAAMDCFGLSLGLRESLGDVQGMAISRNNMGQLAAREGRFSEAVQQFSQAAELARRAGLYQLLAQSLSNDGYALTLEGQPAEALPVLREAETLCDIHGFKNLMCETLWKRAECLVEAGDLAGAALAAGVALEQALDLDSRDLQSEARRVLSRIARRDGRPDEALKQSRTAWEARQREASPILRTRFAAEYSLALKANGEIAEARKFVQANVSPSYSYASQAYLLEIDGVLSGDDESLSRDDGALSGGDD